MFAIDQNITLDKIREKNLMKAFFSMNNHQIATPEMMLEDARSFILFFRESAGKLSAYIGLQLLVTGRKLFYSHSSNPFSEDEIKSIEEEALIFVEGLGALLDEKDFSQLTSREKQQWMEDQEIFVEKAVPERREAETAVEAPHEPKVPQEPAVQQGLQSAQTTAVTSGSAAAPQPPQQQAPPVQNAPQPPQQATQYVPQIPSVPVAPQAAPPPAQQAQPVGYEQQAFETQKEKPAPKRENRSPLPGIAKQMEERPVEAEEAPEKPAHGPSAKGRQEIMQKAIKAGIVKAPKPLQKKEGLPATGVVSRDREALARLLTSF